MNQHTKKASVWVYRGIWRVLSNLFKVPEHPPTLPIEPDDFITSFHPSERYLSYLKFYFWILFFLVDIGLVIAWGAIYAASQELALWLALPFIILAVVPDIVAYIMIHLRYDTMWYVMTDRSLRCRRGIWIIYEHTITFENVQNVHVKRGPIQYFFKISTLVVETAGADIGGEGPSTGNQATMEGLSNVDEIREMIMSRVDKSKTAGLGDERPQIQKHTAWSEAEINTLREIRDEVRGL